MKKINEKHPLSVPTKRNFRLGNQIKPHIVKSRFVKWPQYVQIQRKKRVLMRRLKVPAAVAQFFNHLDRENTKKLFSYLKSYKPETRVEKKNRLKSLSLKEIRQQKRKANKPITLKFGLNHVTYLIEQKKAKLVVIAADVDPIETVVFLPTLCRSMGIPFAIVQNKANLGKLVGKKSATAVALTDFKEHSSELANLSRVFNDTFNNAEWLSKSFSII